MYDDLPVPRARLLSLLVAAACAGVSAPALALPDITLAATYALSGGPQINGLTDPSAQLGPDTSFPSATGSDFYLSKQDGQSSVFFHTYGFTGGSTYFGARASGEGADFYARTSSLYRGSFTNTGSTAVALTFGFYVDGGEVALWGDGVGTANLRLQVRKDGTAVATDDTTITQTASGVTCSENDLGVLGGWSACASSTANSVSAAGGAYSLDLGFVAAGQTVSIEYDIISTVSGQYVLGTGNSSGNCYGGYATLTAEGGETPYVPCVSYNGIARSGDPFNGNGLGNNVADFSLTAQGLPEPGSMALLAAAGGGWWLSRRRRRDRSAG